MTTWNKHRASWKDCDKCELCEGRTRTVLARGKLPCDVLFIGEAPGVSEDLLGKPFIGPAGKLLDAIIDEAIQESGAIAVRYAFTNLVACIPLDDEGNKTKEPPPKAIKTCRARLRAFTKLSNPTTIIRVGKLSTKNATPKSLAIGSVQNWVDIVHPAAILRADISQRGIAIQRVLVQLTDAFSDLIPF